MNSQFTSTDLPIYSRVGGILRLPVIIKPQAKNSQILGVINGRLKIAIAAPPVDGKANKMLITFISQLLGIKKQEVSIVSGHNASLKMLHLPSCIQDELDRLINLGS